MYGWKDGAAHYFVNDRSQATVIEDYAPENFKKMKKGELVDILTELYKQKEATTVIDENKPSVNDLHPTMKPLKLIGKLILNSSRPEENVLDLFGGSGSTLMACEQTNRKAFIMEYDPKYVDVIIDRWQQFTGKTAILLEE